MNSEKRKTLFFIGVIALTFSLIYILNYDWNITGNSITGNVILTYSCSGADVNRNGSVGAEDYVIITAQNGKVCNESNSWCYNADIDRNGVVSLSDSVLYGNHLSNTSCQIDNLVENGNFELDSIGKKVPLYWNKNSNSINANYSVEIGSFNKVAAINATNLDSGYLGIISNKIYMKPNTKYNLKALMSCTGCSIPTNFYLALQVKPDTNPISNFYYTENSNIVKPYYSAGYTLVEINITTNSTADLFAYIIPTFTPNSKGKGYVDEVSLKEIPKLNCVQSGYTCFAHPGGAVGQTSCSMLGTNWIWTKNSELDSSCDQQTTPTTCCKLNTTVITPNPCTNTTFFNFSQSGLEIGQKNYSLGSSIVSWLYENNKSKILEPCIWGCKTGYHNKTIEYKCNPSVCVSAGYSCLAVGTAENTSKVLCESNSMEYILNSTWDDSCGAKNKTGCCKPCDYGLNKTSGKCLAQIKSTVWKDVYILTSSNFENGYTKKLNISDRLKYKFDSEYHYVGILEINKTAKTIKIQVSSTPQNATLSVGKSKDFDVNDDDEDDLRVKLNSVSTGNADITIKAISTTTLEICSDLGGEICTSKEECSDSTVKASDGNCCLDICETIGGGVNLPINTTGGNTGTGEDNVWVYVIIIVIILIIFVGVLLYLSWRKTH